VTGRIISEILNHCLVCRRKSGRREVKKAFLNKAIGLLKRKNSIPGKIISSYSARTAFFYLKKFIK